jgi:hypothetical protein
VRASDVTGMPSMVVTSSGWRLAVAWASIPGRERVLGLGTEISTAVREVLRMLHRAAAER